MTTQKIIYGLLGFVIGIIVMGLVVYSTASDIMIVENESKYGFDETIEKIQQASDQMGWKIPAIHRIDKSVNKAGYYSLPVAVIELCKPSHAAKVLENDDDKVVTSMMPCRVSIYQTRSGKVIVSRMNTGLVSKVFSETVAETMEAATKDTEEIFNTVIK